MVTKTKTMRMILICVAGFWISTAQASLVTYEYQGAPFDEYFVLNANRYLNAPQPYFTGTLTIDTSFLPRHSIKNASYSATVWAFIYGGCRVAGCSGTPIYDYAFFDGLYTSHIRDFIANQFFSFSTDAQGNLTSWNIVLEDEPYSIDFSSTRGDRLWACFDPDDYPETADLCARANTPGTWTRVDEPGALAVLFAGIVGFGLMRVSRRRGPVGGPVEGAGSALAS